MRRRDDDAPEPDRVRIRLVFGAGFDVERGAERVQLVEHRFGEVQSELPVLVAHDVGHVRELVVAEAQIVHEPADADHAALALAVLAAHEDAASHGHAAQHVHGATVRVVRDQPIEFLLAGERRHVRRRVREERQVEQTLHLALDGHELELHLGAHLAFEAGRIAAELLFVVRLGDVERRFGLAQRPVFRPGAVGLLVELLGTLLVTQGHYALLRFRVSCLPFMSGGRSLRLLLSRVN